MKQARGGWVALLLALTVSFAAHAATVETKVRLLVRDRPTTSSRIVDRVPAGKRLPVLGREGNWIHVRSGGHDGWIPSDAVKGGRNEDDSGGGEAAPEDEEPAKPLAKKRGVRPEAWVSKSRYHEGDEQKLIISVNKAELYGRPSSTGAVLGILRRGEAVTMVTRSPDKKWLNVDIGGGSTAWIEAKAVKPGKVQTETPPPEESAEAEAAPPPTITPEGAKKKAKLAKVETPPPPEQQQEEPPPPPPPVKKKKTRTPPPDAQPDEQAAPPPGKSSEDEAPPGLEARKTTRDEPPPDETPRKRKKSRKLTKLASRGDEEATSSAPEGTIVRDRWNTRGKVYVTPAARAGIGIIEQRFTSNGSGPLTNYQASTGALGVQVGLGLWGTVGKYLLLGGDGSYTFVGAAALRYVQPTDGTTVTLGVQAHTADVGLSAGLHFGVLGGLSVRLRLGGQMILNLVQPDVRTKLPSDRILGMTIGLGVAAPALFHLANRPFGVALFGGGLVPAARAQTLGLEDGAQSTTFGAFFGGGLSYALMAPNPDHYHGQLALEAVYNYEFAATHYTGLSRRNNSITIADRGSAQHLIALGLGFYY